LRPLFPSQRRRSEAARDGPRGAGLKVSSPPSTQVPRLSHSGSRSIPRRRPSRTDPPQGRLGARQTADFAAPPRSPRSLPPARYPEASARAGARPGAGRSLGSATCGRRQTFAVGRGLSMAERRARSALLRFFDTVMPDDQEISGALEEILTLIRNYGAGQASFPKSVYFGRANISSCSWSVSHGRGRAWNFS
jgi:hypothetical protein